MENPTKTVHGPFSVYFVKEVFDPAQLTRQLTSARTIEGKGRGGIKILAAGAQNLACRQYMHGGLLRAATGDRFFSGSRALRELETTVYLQEKGFPVIEPFAVIVEDRFLRKRLYFITVLEKEATDLLQFLQTSGQWARYRLVRRLAKYIYLLETLGIYHPDLHLNNVLITKKKVMKFLDFDKSRRGSVTKEEVVRMVFRLNRYAEKMEKKGIITFTMKERMLFLRTYQRLSGYDIISAVAKQAKTKKATSRIGWFVERLLYSSNRSSRQV
jgi:hypothetical protein